jgi:hypothetical protein
VVASAWEGKELVEDGRTGLLVPTCLVAGSTANLSSRVLVGELKQDSYLALVSQAVVVDCAAVVRAFTRLLGDPEAARRMGQAGRERAVERYSGERVVEAHDLLWRELEAGRAARGAQVPSGPACYPAPETTFAALAARSLGDDDRVQAVADNETRLHQLLTVALTSYAGEGRATDPVVLRSVLNAAAAPVTIRALDGVLREAGVGRQQARATVAWMLKYGLLASVDPGE